MAHLTTRFFANTLGMCTRCEVLLPDRPKPNTPIPTLYLFHGQSDDETIWMRRTSLELFAGAYHLAVVMPFADRSYYSDRADGTHYQAYVEDELPSVMESYFPLCRTREGRFVAGLSMGGYGAFKTALRRPDRFSACAGLSSVCDTAWLRQASPEIYAGNFAHTPPVDLFAEAEKVAALPPEARPRLFQYCGMEDFLRKDNLRFRDHLQALGLLDRWEEGPGGHSWTNWNERIAHVLAWLPLTENGIKTDAIGL